MKIAKEMGKEKDKDGPDEKPVIEEKESEIHVKARRVQNFINEAQAAKDLNIKSGKVEEQAVYNR